MRRQRAGEGIAVQPVMALDTDIEAAVGQRPSDAQQNVAGGELTPVQRDACALVDLSAFAVLEVSGPAALDAVQTLSVAQLDVPAGRVVPGPMVVPDGLVRSRRRGTGNRRQGEGNLKAYGPGAGRCQQRIRHRSGRGARPGGARQRP